MTTKMKRKSATVELKALLGEDGDKLRRLLQKLLEQQVTETPFRRRRRSARRSARATAPGTTRAAW